ncbi:MAG: hypothetical protein V4710_11495 [Verrucomicrobiota bacterium]
MPRIHKVTLDSQCPMLLLNEAPQNRSLLPFDGSLKAHLSEQDPFSVHQATAVTDPKQFWALAPGIIVYPEAMIGDDVYDSPYYCWAYHVELLSFRSETDDFRGMNTEQSFPHPRTGFRFDLNYSYPLFRMEGESITDLFCLEGQAVPGDELISTCKQYGLKGLCFEEVWSW